MQSQLKASLISTPSLDVTHITEEVVAWLNRMGADPTREVSALAHADLIEVLSQLGTREFTVGDCSIILTAKKVMPKD